MIPMQPFDRAWQVLKFTTGLPGSQNFKDKRTAATVREAMDAPMAHLRQAASGGYSQLNYSDSQPELQPRPKTFENRQFNVKTIEDEDTRGRVRDTYQELDPANFSTGDDMDRRLSASQRTAREDDPDDFDYRPVIDGMRVNSNPDYPALSNITMDPRLKYPYPKDANNPGDFAGGY